MITTAVTTRKAIRVNQGKRKVLVQVIVASRAVLRRNIHTDDR